MASPGPLYSHLRIDPERHYYGLARTSRDVHGWVRRRLGPATRSAEIVNLKRAIISEGTTIEPTLYGLLVDFGMRAPQLRRLVISGCTGVISGATFAALQHLSNLQHLHVESVYIPAWRDHLNAAFEGMSRSVQHVHVSFEHPLPTISVPRIECGFPKALLRCTQLTTLALLGASCKADASHVLSGLLRLGRLPAGLSTLQRLEELTLINASVTSIPDELCALPCLRVLQILQAPSRLHRDEQLKPAPQLDVSSAFSALTSLQRLALTCPEVPAAVPKLGALTELWLDQLGSAGDGAEIDLAGIAGLTNLGSLRLSNGGRSLRNGLPSLATCRVTALQLDSCGLQDAHLKELADLKPMFARLHVLCLRRNLLQAPPPMLDCMFRLQMLDLSYNPDVSIAAARKLLSPRHCLEFIAALQEPRESRYGGTKLPPEWTLGDVQEVLAMQREAAQRPADAPALHLAVNESYLSFPQLEDLLPYEQLLKEAPRDSQSYCR